LHWIWEGIKQAAIMLLTGDPEVMQITWLTLKVSGLGTLVSVLIGIPVGTLLALKLFWGRKILVSLVNTGMGLPPVVVGLWVSLLLWRSGPLGVFRLIYTPAAIVIAQAVIATPIVTGLTIAAIQQIDRRLQLQILSLGASPLQFIFTLYNEARLGLLAAVIAGFGGVISEVGDALMVGGNVRGDTRVLTTATMLAVSKGDFPLAIALSLILLLLSYLITLALTLAQQHRIGAAGQAGTESRLYAGRKS